MLTIKNRFLTASFDPLGAELKRLTKNNEEYIFGGDPKIWNYSSPILFPICGGLKDDEYVLGGNTYSLPKHGFARTSLFEVESHREDSITFLLSSDDETKKNYPFDFEFRVVYALKRNALNVKYDVKNLGDGEMYFSVGAHEAYLCKEGIEDYDILFPEKETLNAHMLVGNLVSDETVTVLENQNKLSLKNEYFSVDALVFKKFKSNSVILKNRNTEKSLRVSFPEFTYLLFWTKPNAPYICIEPWCGIGDGLDSDKNFKTKEGIITLKGKENREIIHTIEIL